MERRGEDGREEERRREQGQVRRGEENRTGEEVTLFKKLLSYMTKFFFQICCTLY